VAGGGGCRFHTRSSARHAARLLRHLLRIGERPAAIFAQDIPAGGGEGLRTGSPARRRWVRWLTSVALVHSSIASIAGPGDAVAGGGLRAATVVFGALTQLLAHVPVPGTHPARTDTGEQGQSGNVIARSSTPPTPCAGPHDRRQYDLLHGGSQSGELEAGLTGRARSALRIFGCERQGSSCLLATRLWCAVADTGPLAPICRERRYHGRIDGAARRYRCMLGGLIHGARRRRRAGHDRAQSLTWASLPPLVYAGAGDPR